MKALTQRFPGLELPDVIAALTDMFMAFTQDEQLRLELDDVGFKGAASGHSEAYVLRLHKLWWALRGAWECNLSLLENEQGCNTTEMTFAFAQVTQRVSASFVELLTGFKMAAAFPELPYDPWQEDSPRIKLNHSPTSGSMMMTYPRIQRTPPNITSHHTWRPSLKMSTNLWYK